MTPPPPELGRRESACWSRKLCALSTLPPYTGGAWQDGATGFRSGAKRRQEGCVARVGEDLGSVRVVGGQRAHVMQGVGGGRAPVNIYVTVGLKNE